MEVLEMSLESLPLDARSQVERWWSELEPEARAALALRGEDAHVTLVGKAEVLYEDEEGYVVGDGDQEARELFMWTSDFLQHARESNRFPFLGDPQPLWSLGSLGIRAGGWSLCRVGDPPLNLGCGRSCSAHGRIREPDAQRVRHQPPPHVLARRGWQ